MQSPERRICAYYRSESERVQRLADGALEHEGRRRFEVAAAEYRSLAEWCETSGTTHGVAVLEDDLHPTRLRIQPNN